MDSRSNYPSATLICGDLNRVVPGFEEGQGKGKREYRLVPRFLSQMIRWMEAITDDSFPKRNSRRTDMERKMR